MPLRVTSRSGSPGPEPGEGVPSSAGRQNRPHSKQPPPLSASVSVTRSHGCGVRGARRPAPKSGGLRVSPPSLLPRSISCPRLGLLGLALPRRMEGNPVTMGHKTPLGTRRQMSTLGRLLPYPRLFGVDPQMPPESLLTPPGGGEWALEIKKRAWVSS